MKLTAPLCLNFLMIVHFEGHQKTVFDEIAGEEATLAFVRSFLQWFPCVIVVLYVSNFFNLYSKFMKLLKLDELTYCDFYDPDRLDNGKQALARERGLRSSPRELQPISAAAAEKGRAFLYVPLKEQHIV